MVFGAVFILASALIAIPIVPFALLIFFLFDVFPLYLWKNRLIEKGYEGPEKILYFLDKAEIIDEIESFFEKDEVLKIPETECKTC